MLTFKAPLKNAESVKKYLFDNQLFDKSKKPKKGTKYIYFPVIKKDTKAISLFLGSKYEDHVFEDRKEKKDYKAYVKSTAVKTAELPSSFDIIGDIIIIDINEKNKKIEKEIGAALLKAHKNIKVILKKSGQHEGEFRTQPLAFLSGEKRKETTYKENNVSLRLDVEKVYFSSRLSAERKRIFQQVKEGEEILVMFSGCGPYPLVISKNTKAKHIIGIEKNPIACKYSLENQKKSKIKNIEFIQGDVKDIVPTLKKKFDRILLPLPKGAEDFLGLAFSVSKKGTIIHFYDFEHENEFMQGEEKVKRAAHKYKNEIKIFGVTKCGQYSPGKYRICVDFQVI